jgi:hypothetical protein
LPIQSGICTKIHDGLDEPINVLQEANGGQDVWIGFSHGDLAIF